MWTVSHDAARAPHVSVGEASRLEHPQRDEGGQARRGRHDRRRDRRPEEAWLRSAHKGPTDENPAEVG